MFTPNLKKGAVLLGSSVCIALVLALVAPEKAQAQVLYGSLVGNVKDPSGAAVPKATITTTNQGTNQTREVTTDEADGLKFRRPPPRTSSPHDRPTGVQNCVHRENASLP